MNFSPDSRTDNMSELPAANADKHSVNGFEKAMVGIGSLVTYLTVYAVRCSGKAAVCGIRRIRKDVRPLFSRVKINIVRGLKKIGIKMIGCAAR